MTTQEYSPLKGFYDLRDFKIPTKTIFKKLAKMQRALFFVNKQWLGYTKEQKKVNRQYFIQWQNASGEYQQILFSYEEKSKTGQLILFTNE